MPPRLTKRPWTITGGPSAWRSRSSTTCSTFRGTRPSWASAWARIPSLGKWTYPRFLGIDGSRRRAQQLADEAVAALAATRLSRPPPARAGAGSFGKGSLMVNADSLLARIGTPADLKKLSEKELDQLAAEMRTELIGVVGRRSAHFASNLGVVELCLALHLTFDFSQDRLIWDTGHQIYPHKLITGRAAELHTIRTRGGPDGLPQPGREPLRPVHDRARRLCPVHGSGAEGRRRDHGPAASAFRGRHRRRRAALGHRLRGTQRCQRSEDQAAGHPQRQPDVDLPAGRRAWPIISTARECPRRTTTGTSG